MHVVRLYVQPRRSIPGVIYTDVGIDILYQTDSVANGYLHNGTRAPWHARLSLVWATRSVINLGLCAILPV